MQNETYLQNTWLSIVKPTSGKILILELSTKMFLNNQIAGFSVNKIISLKKIDISS